MNIRDNRTKDAIELLACALIFFGIVNLINHSDNVILAKRQSYHILSNSLLPQGQPYVEDEMRISNLFVEDTLPRLIRYGLVKKYELTQCKTVLFVNGKLWKQLAFFKDCLLKEILVHNKINGHAPETLISTINRRDFVLQYLLPMRLRFFESNAGHRITPAE